MSDSPASQHPGLDPTHGALFIGTSLAGVLLGVSCLQVFIYATHYPGDPWYLKALVAATLICDVLHQLMFTHSIYDYLVLNYGNPEELLAVPWSLVGEVQTTATICLLVQGYWTSRVFRLSDGNWWLTAIVSSPVIPSFVLQTYITARMANFKTIIELAGITDISNAINGLNVAADVMLTSAMVVLLVRSRTGFRQTNTIINRLLVLVVNTGLLATVCAMAGLICQQVVPTVPVYTVLFTIVPRFYSNSLFATLNLRSSLRPKPTATTNGGISLSFALNAVTRSDGQRSGGQFSSRSDTTARESTSLAVEPATDTLPGSDNKQKRSYPDPDSKSEPFASPV